MSSILDALNKLEQEKSQSVREAEHADTDPMSAAQELVGRSVLRDRVTLRVTPVALLATIGVLAVVLVVVTVSAAVLVLRSSHGSKPSPNSIAETPAPARAPIVIAEAPVAKPLAPALSPPPPIATPARAVVSQVEQKTSTPSPNESALVKTTDLPPTPDPAPAAEISNAAAVEKQVVDAAPKIDAPAVAPEAAAENPSSSSPKEIAKPTKLAKREPAVPAAKEQSADAREPEKMAANVPARSALASRATAVARPARDPNVALDSLPLLTPGELQRFGFSKIRVNLAKPAGDTNPRGSAIMSFYEQSDAGETRNSARVFEGERLQQSTLRLFKVQSDCLGIEDMRSGEQFQLRN